MNTFENALTVWAELQLLESWHGPTGGDVVIHEVVIEADPGNDRDDSYGESPSTNIVIRGSIGGRWHATKVTPDLLTIVRELTAITREGEP